MSWEDVNRTRSSLRRDYGIEIPPGDEAFTRALMRRIEGAGLDAALAEQARRCAALMLPADIGDRQVPT